MNRISLKMPQSAQRRLLLNSASGTILFCINIVVVFLISPVVVRQLGNRDYGLWDLLLSFCGYLGLLEMGIGPAIIRFIARSAAMEDRQESQRIFVTSAILLVTTGMASLAIMLLISLNPHRIFNISPTESPHLRVLCILAGCNILVQFSGTAPVAFLMGLQQHYQVNTLRMFLAGFSGAATYLALTSWGGSGLLWLSFMLLVGNLLQYSIFALWAMRSAAFVRRTTGLFSIGTIKSLFSFGMNSSLLMLADRIQRQSLPFVIGHSLGVAHIVFYSIPARLIEYGMSLIMTIGFPITPLFSAVEAHSGLAAARQSWLDTSRWMQIVVMWIAVGLAFLGVDFIAIWMGPEYAKHGKWIVIFLSTAMFVSGLAPNSGRVLVALGKHGQVALRLVVISLFAMAASVWAARPLGLTGVALIVSLANIGGFILCWQRACACLKMSLIQHLRISLLSTIPPAAAFAVVLGGLNTIVKPWNYVSLATQALGASVFYLPAVWFFALTRAERATLAGWMINCFRRPGNKSAEQQVF